LKEDFIQMENFRKNPNFGKKSKIWSKIEIWVRYLTVDQIHVTGVPRHFSAIFVDVFCPSEFGLRSRVNQKRKLEKGKWRANERPF